MIAVKCPVCGSAQDVSRENPRREVVCIKCGEMFQLPPPREEESFEKSWKLGPEKTDTQLLEDISGYLVDVRNDTKRMREVLDRAVFVLKVIGAILLISLIPLWILAAWLMGT